ncbi:hypothetical protein FM071_10310 [Sulfurimonas paralvinellae]|uniref:Uncharacterized protein n=1 Tax=Sulfurimonas paralvinellae TaxID=317658 RepID=A0A7M1BAP1_9BACT|nr:hypothetical protein FM071_10310 [Sulfurimonas paralvinellae]
MAKFLERFDDFKECEIRSLEIISPTEMKMTLAVQDKARAYDWITINLLFSDVNDAQLVDENKLPYIDMSEGVSILHSEGLFAFAVGSYKSFSSSKDSSLFIICKNIKYSEGAF